ncbi:CinA family protein [Roseomonas sp. 18066]|uniref:CinA family protein n=1 Tax=Roseomonas sp. 18066 TaxID=2681412 RepID=UPI00135A88A0|nr:nicotinamide-nucleotide amidohydrolase family protein [Roseomonas sp. 18066]
MTVFEPGTEDAATRLLQRLAAEGLTIATAESCTGGLVAAALTAIPGSSASVLAGFVTYSNEAKTRMLGVPAAMLEAHGAVSAEVAGAMAAGALRESGADLAVSTTGIAGPGGATAGKPVGLVYLAAARRGGGVTVQRHVFPGDRGAVRAAAVGVALAMAAAL